MNLMMLLEMAASRIESHDGLPCNETGKLLRRKLRAGLMGES